MYRCSCGKSFSRTDSLSRHSRDTCIYRPSTSGQNSNKRVGGDDDDDDVNYHSMQAPKRIKVRNEINCDKCNKKILMSNYSSHLRSLVHKRNCIEPYSVSDSCVEIISSAFKKRIVSYRLRTSNDDVTLPISTDAKILVEAFIGTMRQKIINLIKEKLKEHVAVKVNFELFGLFAKPAKQTEEEIITEIKSFVVPYRIVELSTDFGELIQDLIEILKKKLEEFQVSRK